MNGGYRDFFEPKVAARVGQLNLVARQAVEGFVSGLHRSPHYGFAIEFAEHRQYAPGDEIRRIDWQAYARTDRFYVKLHEQQTNLRCQILLDASRSMGFAGDGQISKFHYSRYLTALLSYLMLSQQDAVGLSVFDSVIREHFSPSSRMSNLHRIFQALEQNQPGGVTSLVPILHELAERLKQRGLIIVISDLLDEPEQVMRALQHFVYRKHQVIVFHLMDPMELDFPYDRLTTFVDLESAYRMLTDPRQIRKAYLQELETFLRTYRQRCTDAGIEYLLVNTSERYDEMLVRYLVARRRLIK